MSLRDILIALTVDVSGKENVDAAGEAADRAKSKFEVLAEKVNTFAQAMAGAAIVKGTVDFIAGVVEMGAKVSDTANRLGVGADELQAWQFAAENVGVSGDTAGRSLAFLERQLGNAAIGTKASAKAFAGLGVSIRDSDGRIRPMGELLPSLADGFEKLKDEPTRAAYAMKIFGRQGLGMIPVLRQGSEGLRKLYSDFEALGGGLKGDFLAEAKEADRGMTRLSWAFNIMKSRVVLGMLPALETGMGALIKVFGWMGKLADSTLVAQSALVALGAVALALFAPMLIAIAPVVASVTALYLIFDDLFTLFMGGDSLIGRFIDELFGQGAHESFVKTVKEDLELFIAKVREYLPSVKEFFDIVREGWNAANLDLYVQKLGSLLKTLGKIGVIMAKAITGDFSGAATDTDHLFDDREKDERKEKEAENATALLDFKRKIDLQNSPTLALGANLAAQGLVVPGLTPPPQDEQSGAASGAQAPVITNHIHVHGATTNEGTAAAVAKGAEDGTGHALRKAQAAVKTQGGGH